MSAYLRATELLLPRGVFHHDNSNNSSSSSSSNNSGSSSSSGSSNQGLNRTCPVPDEQGPRKDTPIANFYPLVADRLCAST